MIRITSGRFKLSLAVKRLDAGQGLLKLTGSARGLRIWLNARNPELDNELPIDYIKEGHVEDVAAMVEDALLGHPS